MLLSALPECGPIKNKKEVPHQDLLLVKNRRSAWVLLDYLEDPTRDTTGELHELSAKRLTLIEDQNFIEVAEGAYLNRNDSLQLVRQVVPEDVKPRNPWLSKPELLHLVTQEAIQRLFSPWLDFTQYVINHCTSPFTPD